MKTATKKIRISHTQRYFLACLIDPGKPMASGKYTTPAALRSKGALAWDWKKHGYVVTQAGLDAMTDADRFGYTPENGWKLAGYAPAEDRGEVIDANAKYAHTNSHGYDLQLNRDVYLARRG